MKCTNVTPRLRPLRELPDYLGIDYNRAAALARQHLIPTVRLGRNIFFVTEQIEEFIATGGRALPGGWRREAPGA